MIDENMVERVARAMLEAVCAAARARNIDDPLTFETLPASDSGVMLAMARAAIEAMNLDTIPIVDIADIDRVD